MADAQLLQYILAQERAGFREDQIRQSLVSNGYPQEAIDEAFRELGPTTVDPTVHEYVQQYSRQGYSAQQTLTMLLQQGFVPKKIRRAINDVYGPGSVSSGSHTGVVVFIVIALFLFIGGWYFLSGTDGSQQPLSAYSPSISLSPPETIAQVLETAQKEGKETALTQCAEQLSGRDRDLCILDVAVLDSIHDSTICGRIIDAEYHDTCLLNFITEEFDSVCRQVTLPASKNTCNSIATLRGAT